MSAAPWSRQFRLACLLSGLHFISAALFATYVDRAVFDESDLSKDVVRYEREGVSIGSVRAHLNAPGPGSFIWIAEWGQVFGRSLRGRRYAVLLSAGVTLAILLALASRGPYRRETTLAVLFAVTFPHAGVAAATVLTEGPALMWAVFGSALVLSAHTSRCRRWVSFSLSLIGGTCIGLSIVSRQYFIALIPTVGLITYLTTRETARPRQWAPVVGSLLGSMGPVLCLVMIWHGLSSPAMVSGISYPRFQSDFGLDPWRPLIALFYVSLYAVPFTFALLRRPPRSIVVWAMACGLTAAALTTLLEIPFFQPGPVRSAVLHLDSTIGQPAFIRSLLVLLASANLVILVYGIHALAWGSVRDAPAVFAAAFLAFFVAEQLFVGGNVPFYERYVFQVAPFLGIVVGAIAEAEAAWARLAVFPAAFLTSQALLWRYAL